MSWKNADLHEEQSYVTAIKLFSDKYQTSLRAEVLSFFTLPITALHLFQKRLQNISGIIIIVAYLLVTMRSFTSRSQHLKINPW